MKRAWAHPEQPYAQRHLELIGSGRDGVWWQADDGMQLQVAAADREAQPAVERVRLSIVAVLLAMMAGGGRRR